MAAPYWCMFDDHEPIQLEADYNAHMKEFHGVDFDSKKVEPKSRPWQCSDLTHGIFYGEDKFVAHLILVHQIALQMRPKTYGKKK